MSNTPMAPVDVMRRDNVETILPLMPNQLGLLLFGDQSQGRDPGFLQVEVDVEGELDHKRWSAAWQAAVDRHQSLRASVRHRAGGDPMAIVWKDVPVEVEFEDWTAMAPSAQAEALETFLTSDREQGLDLTRPPAMRVTTIALGPTHHHVVWTCHHLFLDGWSSAVVFEDVIGHYVGRDASTPIATDSLRSFVQLRLEGPSTDTEEYWEDRLRGLGPSRRLDRATPTATQYDETPVEIIIPATTTNRLLEVADRESTTANAIVQAAWSLVLSRMLDSTDVVFGTTVSGRMVDVPDIDRSVGYFANAVPIRIEIDTDETVGGWLRSLREQQITMQSHEHASLADIQRWAGHTGGPLFESFVVVGNFPAPTDDHDDELTMSQFRSDTTSAFPITVAVVPADPWTVVLQRDPRYLDRALLESIGAAFVAAMEALTASADDAIGSVLGSLPDLSAASVAPADQAHETGGRPPETPTESRLLPLWQSAIGVEAIGVGDDFFDIGGTSLAAVALFDAIAEEFGTNVPVHTLLQHPTISTLAKAIDDAASFDSGAEHEARLLIPLQPHGDGVPLFAIHGGGGHVMFYRSLAARMPPERPFYGIEPIGLDGGAQPLESIPAMADAYVEAIRSVQPNGPYHLIGYCFGAPVGLEIARTLEADGEDVAMLTVIDGVPGESDAAQPGALRLVKRTVRRTLRRGTEWWDGSFGGTDGLQRIARDRVSAASQRAFVDYQPAAVAAPITVIRARDSEVGAGHDLGWSAYSPDTSVHEIDTHHVDFFEPPAVDGVATIVSEALGDASG